jgi:transcription antitermination factor NusG
MPASPNGSNGLLWFAIQTRPRWEKYVHDALAGKGYELFLPVYTSRRRWSDRIKELELPLFSGYLFCRLNLEARRLPVLTTPGVRQIVGIGKAPVSVPDSEIDAVRAVVASGLAVQPWPFLRLGHRVRIRGGSLDGVEGILLASRKRHRLVVSVELLQRSVAVDVDQASVEAVAPSAPPKDRLTATHKS